MREISECKIELAMSVYMCACVLILAACALQDQDRAGQLQGTVNCITGCEGIIRPRYRCGLLKWSKFGMSRSLKV